MVSLHSFRLGAKLAPNRPACSTDARLTERPDGRGATDASVHRFPDSGGDQAAAGRQFPATQTPRPSGHARDHAEFAKHTILVSQN